MRSSQEVSASQSQQFSLTNPVVGLSRVMLRDSGQALLSLCAEAAPVGTVLYIVDMVQMKVKVGLNATTIDHPGRAPCEFTEV